MQYDCTSAPLQIYGIMFSWWNDNDGNPHYFWSGGKSNVHTCQCGIERNCVEDLAACNCDSSLPTPLTDIGNYHGQGINRETGMTGLFYYYCRSHHGQKYPADHTTELRWDLNGKFDQSTHPRTI